MRHARVIVVFAFGVLGAAAAAQACGGSSDASSFGANDPSGGPTGGVGTGSPPQDVVQPPIDSGPDGETITDGGSNYPEGGEDAGECPIPLDLVQDGPEPLSECIWLVPQAQLQGGALVEGKYHLKSTRALAPRFFCENQFQPVPIGGTLTLAQTDAGTRWVFEVVFSSGGNERRTRAILTPAAGNTSPLQADPVCPDRPPGAVRYGTQPVTLGDGAVTQRLVILLPYGNGGAVYAFEKTP